MLTSRDRLRARHSAFVASPCTYFASVWKVLPSYPSRTEYTHMSSHRQPRLEMLTEPIQHRNGNYVETQTITSTISIPLLSPPSYLWLHIPSFSLFQYAPLALCIPLRPTFLRSSEPPMLTDSSVSDFTPSAAASVCVPATDCEGSDRCWIIVLLTQNLYFVGLAPSSVVDVVDSEMRLLRTVFMIDWFQVWHEACS